MLICDNGIIREMTEEEVYIADNLPDPTIDVPAPEELLVILTGEAE